MPTMWKRALLKPDASVQDAIANLNESSLQIIVVVDDEGRLAGTVTDGDIRRGLLRGLQLDSPLASIVHGEALVVPGSLPRETVLQIMQANKIHQLPVVDADRRVIGLHLWGDLVAPERRDATMVIMAGGRGTRLLPHTENCPKPLLLVRGKPMLQHLIERARAEGIVRFVIAVRYLGHMIKDYFGDGHRWKVQIDYVHENEPLGTAGALRLLDPVPTEPFIVANGDILTDVRFTELLEFHSAHQACATMAVRLHEWQHPYGVVRTDGIDIVGFEEKPVARTHVNAGIYVLSPSSLSAIEDGEACDMPTLFVRLKSRQERTIAFPMHEPWLDIGLPSEYERAGGGLAATPEPEDPKL